MSPVLISTERPLAGHVIYEWYVQSGRCTTHSGIGDLPGLIEKLDYLQMLGITIIWLTPIFDSDMVDNGYDIKDFCSINPIFGNDADFDELVRKARQRGIRIMLDFVFNHVSDQHPWFLNAVENGPGGQYWDYFYFVPGEEGDPPPSNHRSVFGGSAWRWIKEVGHWVYHVFDESQIDLNTTNPDVLDELDLILEYWYERGIGAGRYDALHMTGKELEQLLQDEPVRRRDNGGYLGLKHTRTTFQPGMYKVLSRISDTTTLYGGVMIVETSPPHFRSSQTYVRGYQAINRNNSALVYFGLKDTRWKASSLKLTLDKFLKALPPGSIPVIHDNNHDASRSPNRRGGLFQALGATMLVLFLPGSPIILYGEELGMQNLVVSQLIGGPNPEEFDRALGRGLMMWTDDENAGFASPGVKTWNQTPPDYVSRNVDAQLANTASHLRKLMRAIDIREEYGLSESEYVPLDSGNPDNVFVLGSRREDQLLVMAINTAESYQEATLPPNLTRILLGTHRHTERPYNGEVKIMLAPHEALILR